MFGSLPALTTELLIKRPGFNKRNIDRLREAFSKHGWELEREFGDRQLEEIWGAKILKFPESPPEKLNRPFIYKDKKTVPHQPPRLDFAGAF